MLLGLQEVVGQQKMSLSMAIEQAQQEAFETASYQADVAIAKWNYKVFRANLLPQVNLEGSPLSYSKQVNPITQPDGGITYQSIEQNNASLRLNVNQAIPLTGGKLYVGSQLYRFDNFLVDQQQYSTQPFFIGYSQPILKFNPQKWERQLQPLYWEEAQKQYTEDMAWLAVQTTDRYFEVLKTQERAAMAKSNFEDSQKILDITRQKLELGRASQNDLLQVELNVINAKSQLAQARFNNQKALRALRDFLRLDLEEEGWVLSLPTTLFKKSIDRTFAWQKAKQNRKDFVAYHRKLLEAKRNTARAKGQNRFQADVDVSIGFNNQAGSLADSYSNAVPAQTVGFTFTVPMLDWGKGKNAIRSAQAQVQKIQAEQQKDQVDFQRNVLNLVEGLEIAALQVERAAQARAIALKKYEITLQRFRLGALSLRELIWNTTEKDNTHNAYILALEGYWTGYYQLMTLTLYDFEKEIDIETNFK
ncbi:TolC family protein [Algivirga pacifica]|uniref:TolC family protein n=2 Tax=Algivirga pacifica TaxID=1162670 RepID=A0ABP9DRF3_9BACT